MLLLSAPFDAAAVRPPRALVGGCGQVLLVVGPVAALGVALEGVDPAWGGLGHALAPGSLQAGLLAIGWLVATGAGRGWRAPVSRLGITTVGATLIARLGQWGPLAFVLIPLMLIREARGRVAIGAVGFCGARPIHALTGTVAGGFIGAHLLVTASLTLGYHVHVSSLTVYLGALAYDVGANVLSAEWLFRGALFTAVWRRSAFWPAATATTALAILRYLLDPALPTAAEARAGAVFYLGLVGLTACALRAWSGSLLPGYLAGLAFFAAYRMLTP